MTTPAAPPPLPRYQRVLRIAGWATLTALVVAVARSLDWTRTLDTIHAATPGWLVVAMLANGAILLLWGAFWGALLPPGERVSYGVMVQITSIASALMNTVPFLGGHASSAVLLVRRGGVSQHGALCVMALDQLGEGVAKLLIFLAVSWLAPLPPWMRAGIFTTSCAVGALLVVLLVAAHRHRADATVLTESPSRMQRARAFFARWAYGLEVLRSWPRTGYALVCVLAMKAVEAVAIYAVQRSFGVDLPLSGTLLVLAAVVLGTILPVVPGNVGTYEGGVFLAYRHLGLAPEQAAALALIQHVCFMLPAIGVGYVLLAFGTRKAIASA